MRHISVVILFCFLSASILYGNNEDRRIRIGLEYNYSYLNGSFAKEFNTSRSGGTLALGWDFSKYFGLDLVLGPMLIYSAKDIINYKDAYSSFFGLNSQWTFSPSKKLTPFLNLGVNMAFFTRNFLHKTIITNTLYSPPEKNSVSYVDSFGAALSFGAGIKYSFFTWMSLDLSFRYYVLTDMNTYTTMFGTDYGDLMGLGIGLVFHI